MSVELIDFREPEEAQLYVSKIKWDKDRLSLIQLLKERFSSYGLLHFINTDANGKYSLSWNEREARATVYLTYSVSPKLFC